MGEIGRDVSVSDCWIGGGPPGVWVNEISEFPDVLKIDGLAEVGDGSVYRITYRNPPVIYFFRRVKIPIQLPLWMQAGVGGWEVVARFSDFQKIMEFARGIDPQVKITSIHRGSLQSHLPSLTEAQLRLLSEAKSAGFFAVPRRITLTALAQKLNRSKSGLSESIAVIEGKLLETAVNPPSIRV